MFSACKVLKMCVLPTLPNLEKSSELFFLSGKLDFLHCDWRESQGSGTSAQFLFETAHFWTRLVPAEISCCFSLTRMVATGVENQPRQQVRGVMTESCGPFIVKVCSRSYSPAAAD